MGKLATITRRTFLLGSAAIAGGVVFGYYKYQQPLTNPLTANDDEAVLTPYIKLDKNGVTIIAPRAEMGQGVSTTLAVLVAEELDIPVADVNVEHGPASSAYFNAAVLEEGLPFATLDNSFAANTARGSVQVVGKLLGLQVTGGSSSIVDAFEKMRVAGAAAREVLLMAAAAKWSVEADTLDTDKGFVVNKANSERVAYSDLASVASRFEPPTNVSLKPQSDWQQLGKSQPRNDMVSKCTGTAEFAIDVKLEDLRHATVKMNPYIYQKMRSYDASEAEKMPGVEKIIPILDQGVAVIASNTWYAMQAAKKITFDWGDADYPKDNAALFRLAEKSFADDYQDSRNRDQGDVDDELMAQADAVLSAEYRAPLLAHATMEPMNATALLKDGRLDIWAGNQAPTLAVQESVKLTGLEADNVHVHTTYMGGGFGRRAEMDFVNYAVEVAKAMEGVPVKVTWSREEDMTHDCYRPMAIAKMQGSLANEGKRVLDIKVAAPSVFESQGGRIGLSLPGPDISIVQAIWDQPYGIENYRTTGYRVPAVLPVSSWRSVGGSQNAFFHESMIDELALAAGKDPLALRLELITDPVSRKVIEAVAELSDWGRELPDGHGLGIAFCLSFGVPTAEVVEVANTDKGIKIINAYVAADVGLMLDPVNVEAQLMSGLNFGLAAAMMSEITLKNGQVEQTNFNNYDSIRMNQTPSFKVKVLENGEKIRGVGEPGTPPAAPALANAIFAATGQRLREMPFKKFVRFA